MQCDLVPGGCSFGEQGQIFLVVVGATTKKVPCTPAAFRAERTSGVVLLGPFIKGQTNPTFSGKAALG